MMASFSPESVGGGNQDIVVRPQHSLGAVLVNCACPVGWLYVLIQIIATGSVAIVFWLAFGVLMVLSLLRFFLGVQVVSIRGGDLIIEQKIGSIRVGSPKVFAVANIRRCASRSARTNSKVMQRYGTP